MDGFTKQDMLPLLKVSEEELERMLEDYPEDEREELFAQILATKEQQQQMFEGVQKVMVERRDKAVQFRKRTGIEDDWLEDEEYYEGIDSQVMGEDSRWDQKPPGRSAPDAGDDDGSTIFLNVTRPYCDAAGASLADMLLPTDDSAWQIVPTPIPDLVPMSKGDIPRRIKNDIRAAMDGDQDKIAETEAKMVDRAVEMVEEAKEKAEKAQKRIEDWHVECQWHREVRKVIEDAARIGTGVLLGPVPEKCRAIAYLDGELIIKEEIKPVSRAIDYRNLYPAPDCGELIHNGSYVVVRDDITASELRDLAEMPGYLSEEINLCLSEGPQKDANADQDQGSQDMTEGDGAFSAWYLWCEATRKELDCACSYANPGADEEVFNPYDDDRSPADELQDNEEMETVYVMATMVNDRLIGISLNTHDSGSFPVDVMVWQRRKGLPWGVGVARQIRTPQRMINGAARNLMDNAGIAGGPMWAFNPNILVPVDGVAELAPRKGWILTDDATDDDINKAFSFFNLDIMVNELQSLIYLGLKMAEDVTGLPMIMQGQMGAQKLDTLGQTELLNNNANIVRRRIARFFDDLVTEPHIRRYYEYLMQYGDDEEKGDFLIDARGSSNLVERTIQKEKTMGLLELAQNPIYGLDPKKVAKESLRADKLDPKNFEYDDEEWQKVVEQMLQPPPDPRTEVAQLNAEMRQAVEQMKEQGQTQRKQMELQQRDTEQLRQQEFDAFMQNVSGELAKELAEMKYLGDKDINTDTLKVKINEFVNKLRTQERLAGMKADPAPQVATPAIEPPGRAQDGRAFQQ